MTGMLWSDEDLLAATGGVGGGFAASGLSIDTRSLQPGDLFIALADARDGHDFVADAFAKGAAGALVSRDIGVDGKQLIVEDTLAGLNRLAAFARARSKAKIVAVTGSVGKTTTKEMLRRALSGFGAVHAAQASFNNHIGVPLTLALLPPEADFAVVEMGMNHPGEIAPLAKLARPDVAVIVSVETAHIGLMGSREAIAEEKASIFSGLRDGGAAVLPCDSSFLTILDAAIPAKAARITFGADADAVARLVDVLNEPESATVTGMIARRSVRFRLAAPGRHMAMNAMAVLGACHALGLDSQKAAAALDGFAPFAGRGTRRAIHVSGGDALLLDESYNASTASIRAALAVLALQPGRHVAVLGDMLEMGAEAETEHLSLNPALDAADIVFTCGVQMGRLFESLPVAKQGAHAAAAAALAPLVKAAVRPGDAVLVKGSYGSRMRDVIAVLESPA